jgi:glycerol kinase
MEADSNQNISLIKATGGATINQYLMQFQADIMNTEVCRPEIMETTALGAAYLAGLESGYWRSMAEIHQNKSEDDLFKPDMKASIRKRLISGWKLAVESTRNFKIDDIQ